MMVKFETFSREGVITPGLLDDLQRQVRVRAQEFIADEVSPDHLVEITESYGATVILPFLHWMHFSVTVWYHAA